MPGPQPYRVSAYNTSKQSENKIHDDTVARRFGFSGGLVPGVDVMAYMMHLPVEKWGRAFLERGLIDARFVKPVYDGEIAEVTGVESNGALAIEVHSRGELCATGSASLPATAPAISLADFAEAAAVAERKPVNASSYEIGKWLGTQPRAWAGEAAAEYLRDIRETDPIYLREHLGHPGMLQKVMNKALVDNAILGPWIHVGSRMQLLSAAEDRRRNHRPRESDRQLRQEGPPFRRARRAGRRQRHDAAGALPAHRNLPAARAGGGVGRMSAVRRARPIVCMHIRGPERRRGMFTSVFLQNTLTAMASFAGIVALAGSSRFRPDLPRSRCPSSGRYCYAIGRQNRLKRRWQQSSPIALARYGSSPQSQLAGRADLSISLPTRSSRAQCSWRSANT